MFSTVDYIDDRSEFSKNGKPKDYERYTIVYETKINKTARRIVP